MAIRKAGAEPIFMTQAIQWQNLDEDEKKRLWMGAMDGGAAYASEAQMEALVATFNERMLEVAAAAGEVRGPAPGVGPRVVLWRRLLMRVRLASGHARILGAENLKQGRPSRGRTGLRPRFERRPPGWESRAGDQVPS